MTAEVPAWVPSDEAVARLWQDYEARANSRVPIRFAADENLWLGLVGASFRDFYQDPRLHLHAQLEGQRWLREHVAGDGPRGLPDEWVVSVQLWMEENAHYGAQVVYQEDDYAWAQPLPLSRTDLLPYLEDLDPDECVRRSDAFRMWQALSELAATMRYLDRPVRVAPPGGSTHGIFTKAAELRGLEALCLDLGEHPDWAAAYLARFTELTIARLRAWRRATGQPDDLPLDAPFGICDDSLQLLSAATYRRFVLPCHQRLFAAVARGARTVHLCGHSAQHFSSLVRGLGVTTIDGPGPFVDHGQLLCDLGPDLGFNAQTDHAVLLHGSPDDVDAMMHALLSPRARQAGRLNVLGYLTRRTPPENVVACYRAGLRYGQIGCRPEHPETA